jgi:hypothetical protein
MTIDTSRCPPHPLSLQLLALKGDGVARRCEIHHADSPQYRIIRRADSDVDPFSDVVARLTSQRWTNLRHAFARRHAAGEHLQRQQDQHQQQAELRHGTRQRAQEDAHRRGGEQLQHARPEQRRCEPSMGTPAGPARRQSGTADATSTTSAIAQTLLA